MITGGLGGLGLRAAALLVEGGAVHVLLTSRGGRVARDGQGLEAQLALLLCRYDTLMTTNTVRQPCSVSTSGCHLAFPVPLLAK